MPILQQPQGLRREGTTGITLRSVRLIKAQAEAQLSNSWRPQKGWDKADVLLLGNTLGWACRAEEVPWPGKFSLGTRGLHTLLG